MDEVYKQAFAEALEVLQNTDENILKKIPEQFITFLNQNKDNQYQVNIDFTRLEDAMSEFDYTSLTGDMLDVKIHTKVDDVKAVIRIKFIEELNYPLMYVEDIKD